MNVASDGDTSGYWVELARECGPLSAAVQYQIARSAGNAFFERAAFN
jgi:hypothetical protein